MNQPQNKSGFRLVLLWAIVATLVAITSTVTSVVLFLHLRSSAAHPVVPKATAFSELRDDMIPGRYERFDGVESRGVLTLLPDHSFLDAKGNRTRVHQWEIGRDALLLTWSSGIERFTNIESPGVYTTIKPDGHVVRLEKEQ